jgi:site-specific recombinase XerD
VAYERVIAEWLAHGRRLSGAPECYLTVNEVLASYVRHAVALYGASSKEFGCLKDALKIVRSIYGIVAAAEFGPRKLKTVREKMIEKGWCRNYINAQINRIRRVFKWAVAEELVQGNVYHALKALPGIRRGTPGVRESPKVKPVPEHLIDAVLPRMPAPVRAMAELQRLTGLRPGEACIMRGIDLETSGPVWVYRPEHHKTEHHGLERLIYLGPKAQQVIKPWLRPNLEEYLFSPAEWERRRNAERRKKRKTKRWPSHIRSQSRKRKSVPRRTKGDHYDVHAYRRAIKRACETAFPLPEHLGQRILPNGKQESKRAWRARLTPEEKTQIRTWRQEHSWHPHRLRHNAATLIRKERGIELARIILGHARMAATEIYAQADRQQAMEVIAKIG